MSEPVLLAVIGLGIPVSGFLGTLLGAKVNARATVKAAVASASAEVKVSEDTAQDRLIDQLQEELTRYRDDNDKRVARLETKVETLTEENRGYRAFIGVQRDHMAAHGVPLPPYPPDLPR